MNQSISEEEGMEWKNIVLTIRKKVDDMRTIRDNHESKAGITPSQYWKEYIRMFDYMLDSDVPLSCFKNLRCHTYHLTGTMPAHHKINVDQSGLKKRYTELIKKCPKEYRIEEPTALGGFGTIINGKLINKDIIRFTEAFVVLNEANILPQLLQGGHKYVLEIGGGWGGLAHHFKSIVPNCTYIIIDLPETLLFSASYISLLNPDKEIYIFDENYQEYRSNGFDKFDFVLLPNWALEDFHEKIFDLVINQASFQEMTTYQVESYLDKVKEICHGYLYSYNQNFQDYNRELNGLNQNLFKRFSVKEYYPIPKGKLFFLSLLLLKLKHIMAQTYLILRDYPYHHYHQHYLGYGENPYHHFVCKCLKEV